MKQQIIKNKMNNWVFNNIQYSLTFKVIHSQIKLLVYSLL